MKTLFTVFVFTALLIVTALCMGQCEVQQTPQPPPPTTVKADPNALQYIRDERTNLCFARYSYVIPCGEMCSNGVGVSITMIPCEALKGITKAPVEELK